MKFTKKKMIIILILIIIVSLFCIWQNNDIVITEYQYSSSKVPSSFNGFKILQVSDLHNKSFPNSNLVNKTKSIKPDIIVITGDLIDRSRTNIDKALDYIKEAKKIAPIYYVSGNHEQSSGVYEELMDLLILNNVHVLEDKSVKLTKEDKSINIIGVKDLNLELIYEKNITSIITNLKEDYTLNILLSHRPEHFTLYSKSNIDLVFTGHAHGGQIRNPFFGGLIAPNQGLFPKYTNGIHKLNDTSMVVSRGLGNSIFPFRVFNRPELVVVTLKT